VVDALRWLISEALARVAGRNRSDDMRAAATELGLSGGSATAERELRDRTVSICRSQLAGDRRAVMLVLLDVNWIESADNKAGWRLVNRQPGSRLSARRDALIKAVYPSRSVAGRLEQNRANFRDAIELPLLDRVAGMLREDAQRSHGEPDQHTDGAEQQLDAERELGAGPITDPPDYEPVDSFPLFKWSATQSRRHDLRPCRRRDEAPAARVAAFFDPMDWQQAQQQNLDGPLYCLTGMDIEDRDYDKITTFWFSACHYRQALATQDLFYLRAEAREKAERLLIDGAYQFLQVTPPNNVYVNASVVDGDGRLLALRRSSATHDTHNLWTLGVCETM